MPDNIPSNNHILSALPKKEYKNLLPKLERVSLNFNENIYQPGDIIRHIYFPESGIISLLSTIDDQYMLEVGLVGNEGIAGLAVFLGVKTSSNRAVVQGSGFAMRMATVDFRGETRNGSSLSGLILRYVHYLLTQVSQSAVCNRFHLIESRLARWLLMTHDRMQTDQFQITQEFLSNMLGVRREAVNKAAKNLQERQLIKYSRGRLLLLDRSGLERASCSCYKIIKEEYDGLSA